MEILIIPNPNLSNKSITKYAVKKLRNRAGFAVVVYNLVFLMPKIYKYNRLFIDNMLNRLNKN